MKRLLSLILSICIIAAAFCSCSFDLMKDSDRAAVSLTFSAGSVFTLGISDSLQVVYVTPENDDAKKVLNDYYTFSEAPLSYVVENLAMANYSSGVVGADEIEIGVSEGFADKEAVSASLATAFSFLNKNTSGKYRMRFEGKDISPEETRSGYYNLCENCAGTGVVVCPACNAVSVECTACSGSGAVWVKCEKCDGSGKLASGEACSVCEGRGGADSPCPTCGGNGVVNYCSTCSGTGIVTCPECNGTGDLFLQ